MKSSGSWMSAMSTRSRPGCGRGRQPRHRRQLLACRIGALAVQPGQEILPGQLRRRDPGQQLPSAEPALAGGAAQAADALEGLAPEPGLCGTIR